MIFVIINNIGKSVATDHHSDHRYIRIPDNG